jgi:O-antigen ligase
VKIAPAYGTAATVSLALVGVGAAYALAPFANEKPAVMAVAAVFPILLIAMLGVPALQCLGLGPRTLLILLALRPLVDVSITSFQTESAGFTLKASSGLSLQEGFAAVFGVLLAAVWMAEGRRRSEFAKLPNLFLTVLLGLTSLSWVIGGLSEGARGFARTAWGLIVALMLGSIFRTEKQIDIFLRTVFYSSFFVLMTLVPNLSKGVEGVAHDALDEVWRLAGQYGTPNALAGVAFSFFLCGLYVFGRAHTAFGKLLSLLLLSLLALVIVFTQSRTVGGLMLFSVGLWLWTSGRRRLLLGITVLLLFFALASSALTGWRLLSSFSLTNEQLNPNVLTLQGRVVLWGEWMINYQHASLFHKVFGLGWGVVLRNFLSMKFFTSSVTENSFLWFLVGTGALGLLAFCAYLFWVLVKSLGACRRTSSDFQRQFALLAFLTTLSFVMEAFTTDVASAPNADVYIFGIMSMFVFWRSSRVANKRIFQLDGTC